MGFTAIIFMIVVVGVLVVLAAAKIAKGRKEGERKRWRTSARHPTTKRRL